MSKIFGIVNLRNQAFAEKDEAWKNSDLLSTSDGEKHDNWTQNNIRLIQIGPDEIFAGRNELRIAADASLTNRAELFEKFGVFHSDQDKINDQELIVRAYEKWGESCPDFLAGDFAFAIWDKTRKSLFCARDHFGAATLFYFQDSETFVFGSNPGLILNFGGVEKTFNVDKLGIFLIPEPHIHLTDQSWFKNISVFPAGTCLTVDPSGIRTRKYWTPELPVSRTIRTEAETVEAFRELFFQVIEERCSGDKPVASLLSGGLDSSSIVSVAAKILEKQNREINVFSAVLADPTDEEFADESFFIDQFKNFSNVRLNYVTAPGAGPFSDLDDLFEIQDTPFMTSRHYLYRAFTREASAIGASDLLDGSLGELGATSHARGGFGEMFVRFKWLRLWRELRLRKTLYDDSIKYNIRANVINPILPRFLLELRNGKPKDQLSPKRFHPIQEELAGSLFGKIPFSKYVLTRDAPDHLRNQLNDLRFVQEKMSESFSFSSGQEHCQLRFPLIDKRLIEFSLTVPLELKFRDGYYRYLIRVALDQILPPEIQWRTSKTPFSPDYMRRYNKQIGGVREMLESIRKNDPLREVLDIEKIKRWANLSIANTESKTENALIARDYLPQAIYLIYFLRKFSEFRA